MLIKIIKIDEKNSLIFLFFSAIEVPKLDKTISKYKIFAVSQSCIPIAVYIHSRVYS